MQAFNQDDLKKRSRYYHALIAADQLEKGKRYLELGDAYVIFICDFDLFEQNRRIYHFESTCQEIKDLTLYDGAHTIFVAASVHGTSDSKLDEFCEYVHKGSVTGELSERLENARTKVLMNSDWRRDYMFLSDIKYEAHEDGKKEGIEIGRAEGREEGRAEGREEGRAEGRAEGREEGKIETLVSLVDEGFLYKEIAAEKANMTVEEFQKQLKPCIS
jgi:predicted transposase/invertase (TIGR01784 family)